MKNIKVVAIAAVVSLVLGCSDGQSVASAKNEVKTEAAQVKKREHNYEVRDGMDYGYSAAISQDAQQSGQVAPKILMFKYAGQRDGKYQVHTSDGLRFTAIECSSPCEVVKVMTFVDKDYLRDTVHVERIKNQPGSLANLVMDDALNGRLNNYGMERGKQKYQVWVDEKQGYREYLVKVPAKL